MSDPIKVVLVTLSGQGDTDRFVLPEPVYKWMLEVEPGNYTVPEELLELLTPMKTPHLEDWEDNALEEQYATSGSCENDVALFLSCLVQSFDSTREAMAVIQANQWELVDEYDGCIY